MDDPIRLFNLVKLGNPKGITKGVPGTVGNTQGFRMGEKG